MTSMFDRFLKFLKQENTKRVLAFLVYFSVVFMILELEISIVIKVVLGIMQLIVFLLWYILCLEEAASDILNDRQKRFNIKMVVKELVMFIPILVITCLIVEYVMVGTSVNQSSIDLKFETAPIYYSFMIIIGGPIMEEYLFRLLPRKFINNKYVYVIFSSFVFAAMHVVHDPNAFYYIWFYMMRPLYYGYRYYETNNIWVPIAMHSLNNFVATLPLIIKYF